MDLLPDGIPPVVTEVLCTGVVHQVRFASGTLRLLEHDVDAERAMAALGGEVPSCVRLLELWDAATAAVRAGEMGAAHMLARLGQDIVPEPPWEPPKLPFAGPSRPGVVRPLMNARLPVALEDVLAQAAVLDCERRWNDPSLPPASRRTGNRLLTSTVERVVTETLRRSAAVRDPVHVKLVTHVVTDEPVDVEITAGRGQLRLELGLPLGWLVRVWRAGLAAAAGLVVLDVVNGVPGDDQLTVLAISWDVRGRELQPRVGRVALARDGDGWSRRDPSDVGPSAGEPWWSLRTDRR